MKNRAIQSMLAVQYNVDPKRVDVEFLYSIGSEYVFRVIVNLPDNVPTSHSRKDLTIKVEADYNMSENYNEEFPFN